LERSGEEEDSSASVPGTAWGVVKLRALLVHAVDSAAVADIDY
jgi:hypothetical protein